MVDYVVENQFQFFKITLLNFHTQVKISQFVDLLNMTFMHCFKTIHEVEVRQSRQMLLKEISVVFYNHDGYRRKAHSIKNGLYMSLKYILMGRKEISHFLILIPSKDFSFFYVKEDINSLRSSNRIIITIYCSLYVSRLD